MRKFVYLILVTTLLGATACTEGMIGLSNDVEGTYQLHTINGRTLPYTAYVDDGSRQTIHSGVLRLEFDGEFTEEVDMDVTEFGYTYRDPQYDRGFWDVSRGEVLLEYDDGYTLYGELQGRDIVIRSDGYTVVYRRR